MCGFEDPVCVFGVCNCEIIPLYLKVSRGLLQQRRARELMHVEFWFWRHYGGGNLIQLLVEVLSFEKKALSVQKSSM